MQNLKISNRAVNVPPSPIRKLAPLAQKAKNSGVKVFQLNIGQPDIPSPPEFFEGINKFKDKIVAYERSQGHEPLSKAWTQVFNKSLNLNLKPENLVITTGGSEAIIFLFMTCCDPGDEVIVLDPTYANYIGFAACSSINLVPLFCSIENNFALPDKNAIQKKISKKTKAILLCNPNNPTGAVYSKKDLEMLLNVCEEHNLFFLVDEVYRAFVFDKVKPLSILNIAPNNNRVVMIDSLSKHYSLCGARLGCFVTTNEDILTRATYMAQARLSSATLEQHAAAHMLQTISDDYVESVRREYEARRNVLYDALSSIQGVKCYKPGGAFYSVVGLPVDDADKFAAFMLSEFSYKGKTTFVAPGPGFYIEKGKGLNEVRIAYVLGTAALKESMEVLEAGLKKYNGK